MLFARMAHAAQSAPGSCRMLGLALSAGGLQTARVSLPYIILSKAFLELAQRKDVAGLLRVWNG